MGGVGAKVRGGEGQAPVSQGAGTEGAMAGGGPVGEKRNVLLAFGD